MNYLLHSILLLLFCLPGPEYLHAQDTVNKRSFKLEFVNMGFGSNKFKRQPVFRVEDSTFIYTSEIIWVRPGQATTIDTLQTGTFRQSAADSIRRLVYALPDSIIDRPGNGIASGSGKFITIIAEGKKWSFNLFNDTEPTADRIIRILNDHIPPGLRKLPGSKSKRR